MLIKLMGHGGVGKLTIARALAPVVSGRLIDNHTIYNPAFAVAEFRSQNFYDMVRCVRDLVLKQAALIPSNIPLIFTFAPGPDPVWDAEWDDAFRELASERREPLLSITLTCSPEEHRKRIVSPTRAFLSKLTSTHLIDAGLPPPTRDECADVATTLDVTGMSPDHAAENIASWVNAVTDAHCPRS